MWFVHEPLTRSHYWPWGIRQAPVKPYYTHMHAAWSKADHDFAQSKADLDHHQILHIICCVGLAFIHSYILEYRGLDING